MLKPHLTLDSSHLLLGLRKDGWKGLNLQWEFGAYINVDLAWSDRHDYRWTYNTRAWRTSGIHYHRAPKRFEFTRP